MGQGENDPVFLHLSIYFLLFWIVSDFWEKICGNSGLCRKFLSRKEAAALRGLCKVHKNFTHCNNELTFKYKVVILILR